MVRPNAERVAISSTASPIMVGNTSIRRVPMRIEQTSIGSDIAGLPVLQSIMRVLDRKPGKARWPSAASRRTRVWPEFIPRRDTTIRLKPLDVDPGIVTVSMTLRLGWALFTALGQAPDPLRNLVEIRRRQTASRR